MSKKPADADLVLQAISHMQLLSDVFSKRRAQLARRVGLTEQQWRVIEEISTEHFIPSMFARNHDSSAAAVSKILRQLLDKDLVAVSISQDDGRQRSYELSAHGKTVMAKLRAHRQEAIDAIWSNLKREDLNRFCTFAEDLSQRIENYASSEEKE